MSQFSYYVFADSDTLAKERGGIMLPGLWFHNVFALGQSSLERGKIRGLKVEKFDFCLAPVGVEFHE